MLLNNNGTVGGQVWPRLGEVDPTATDAVLPRYTRPMSSTPNRLHNGKRGEKISDVMNIYRFSSAVDGRCQAEGVGWSI